MPPAPNVYWDGANQWPGNATIDGGTANWGDSTSLNWTDSIGQINGAWAAGTSVGIFQSTAGTVTNSTTQSMGGLTFKTTGYAINGGTLNGAATNNVLTADPSVSATISSVLSGSAFSKEGTGTITLSGANTYTGTTTVNAGTLVLANGSGTLPGSNAIVVNNGGTLTTAANVDNTVFSTSATTGSLTVNSGGKATTGNGAAITLNGQGITLAGGELSSGTANTNWGSWIADGGTAVTTTANSTLSANAFNLRQSNTNFTVNSGATLNVTGTLTSSTGAGNGSGTGGLTKLGAGTMTLAGAGHTYKGATVVSAGTLKIGATNSIPTTSVTKVLAGATLDVNSQAQTLSAGLASDGTVALGTGGVLTLSGGSSTIAAVTGSGKIVVGPGATLTLTQNIVNSGLEIELAGGTLNLGGGLTHSIKLMTVSADSTMDFASTGNAQITTATLTTSTKKINATNWTYGSDHFYANAYTSATRNTRNAAPMNQITLGSHPASATTWLSTNEITVVMPTLTLTKALGGSGRIASADQFSLSATGTGAPAAVTTTGSGTTASTNTLTFTATAGSAYSMTEAMASGSGSTLAQYGQAVSCTNTGPTSVSGLTTLPVSVTPTYGDAISCTVTNTPKAPTLTLQKALGGSGRIASADQFSLSATGTGAPAAVTTTGSGTTVSSSALTFTATPGSAYTMKEAMASGSASTLAQYGQAVACTNTGPTSVSGLTTMPIGVTPTYGDAISCTVTNTPKAPTLTLQKALGGSGRIASADQFSLSATGSGAPAAVTTTGSGTTVSSSALTFTATAGSAYSMTEAMASGSGSTLAQYGQTVACTNSGPTSVSGLTTLPVSVTPTYGDAISCTVTNTPKAPTLTLQKALGGSGRIASADQFSLSATGTGAPAAVTTTGSGTTVSSSALTFTATPGSAYTMKEAMASGSASTLAQYGQAVACTNTGPTSVSALTSLPINVTPANGDAIVCTVTNTPKAATLSITKALGGVGRIASNDQFVLSVSGAGAPGAVTTTGSGTSTGSVVLSFAPTVGSAYTMSEAMASGSSSTLGQYTAAVTCTNTGPTDVSGITAMPVNVTPRHGDAIGCTVTNTPKTPTLTFQKALGGTGRAANSDQFSLSATGTGAPASVTTTGSGTTVSSAAMTFVPAAGSDYTLDEGMAAGSASPLSRYKPSVSCTNSGGPTDVSGLASLPIKVKPTYGDAISCTVTNTPGTATGVDGVVFRDTGSGGGVANDGLRNGSEAAVAGVTVRLTDCASTVYGTASTDSAGAFSFADPGIATSGSLCVEETNAAASVSTGASVAGTALSSGTATSVGGTSYTYTRAGSPDRIAFAWNGTGHSGLAFGDVPDNTFIGNGARKTAPGTSTTYAHTFTAGTAGTVLFDIAGTTATPSIGGWSEKIYDDSGCTGKLQTSATLLYPPTGSGTAVVAGQNVCIVVQESAPAAAQTGNKNEAQVRAGFAYANAGPSLSASYSVLDTTEVDSSALGLTKEVRNLTTGGPWGTSNQAKSGEVLEYRVTYTNNSLATMSAFAVNDATPQYTTFQSAVAGTTPAALGNCKKATPQNVAPAAQVACSTVQATGGSGSVRWIFDGVLAPSATGDVRMTVVVD